MKHESPLDPLLKQINSALPLSAGLKECLSKFTNIRYYPRDFVFVKLGDVLHGMAMILKGMTYAGGEKSRWMATEGHLLTPAYKNGRDIIAQWNITVLEDSFVAFIQYPDIIKIIKEFPGFEKAIQTMQVKYNENIAFHDNLAMKTSFTEKLQAIRVQYPGPENKAEQNRIARYLGITAEEYN